MYVFTLTNDRHCAVHVLTSFGEQTIARISSSNEKPTKNSAVRLPSTSDPLAHVFANWVRALHF